MCNVKEKEEESIQYTDPQIKTDYSILPFNVYV